LELRSKIEQFADWAEATGQNLKKKTKAFLEKNPKGGKVLEQNTCPVCGSQSITFFKQVGEFIILKCQNCKLLWVPNVTDAQLQSLYGSGYFKSQTGIGYEDYLADERHTRQDAEDILRQLPIKPNGARRLLDAGCAHGFLLDEARKQGWETCGIDVNPEAHYHATKVLGLNVFCGSLEEARFEGEYFDAVTVIGTLEHLRDPVSLIREANRIMKKGGFLVITTINTEQPVRLFRLIPPEHIFYFSASNLTRLLKSHGFETINCHRHGERFRIAYLISRFFRLVFSPSSRIDRYIKKLVFFRFSVKIPFNEMFILAQKI
jgi:2-polyprenyl-3-methyl-5-hydroxy-6-metoxy-1,4-benzoquinol methylase